ncbi:MAG: signal peptidase I [Pseudomonadota bacterium]
MTSSNDLPAAPTRRVRPWIAALLTFIGLGVGLFYARRTRAAIQVVIIQLLLTVVFAAAILLILSNTGPVSFTFQNLNAQSLSDVIGLGVTAVIAIAVWVYVSRGNTIVEKSGPSRLWGYGAIWLLPIIGGMLLALPLRIFAYQPFEIPAGSMKPTLQIGDFIVAKKWSYGYSRASLVYPLTRMPMEGRILTFSEPKRGDIIVFKNSKDGNKDYIKRVIGMPGDTVQMLGGRVHINGQTVQKDLLDAAAPNVCGRGFSGATYRETLENGVSYVVQECAGDDGHLDNTAAYQVPAGHYFMMGDNRDQSQDSRVISQVGYIPRDAIVGRVAINSKSID